MMNRRSIIVLYGLRYGKEILSSHFHRFHAIFTIPVSSSFYCSQIHAYCTIPNSIPTNPLIVKYLLEDLKFSKTRALEVSNRYPHIKSYEKPKEIVRFLKNLGLSDEQIRSFARSAPQILLSTRVEKTLEPKITFLQEMGLTGQDLSDFISKKPYVLTHSLEKKLKPCIMTIREVLENGGSGEVITNVNKDVFRILSRGEWLVNSVSRFQSNILYLQNCGIFGSQLSALLKRKPTLFVLRETELKKRVSKVLDLGFELFSRMLVHGIESLTFLSDEEFNRKYEVLQSFGFSRNELLKMIRKTPHFFKLSHANLRVRIEFFLHSLKLDKSVLVHRPLYLVFSMEKRVMPRYRVFELLKSKNLLNVEKSFLGSLALSDDKFLEMYVSRFGSDDDELILAYKGNFLDSSKE